MDQQLWGFLGLVVAQLATVSVSYMSFKKSQKNSVEKMIEAQKVETADIIDSIETQKLETTEIKTSINRINKRLDCAEEKQVKSEQKEVSEKGLIDAIVIKAFSIISANSEVLDNDIRAILNATEQKITKFAVSQKNSPYRNDGKEKWKEYLQLKSLTIRDQIKYLANDIYPQKKKVDGEIMDYDEFVYHVTTISTDIAVIIEMLVKNGLTEDEYSELFVLFIETLFKQQIKGWREWHRL